MKKITVLLASFFIAVSSFAKPSTQVTETMVKAEVKKLVALLESKVAKMKCTTEEIVLGNNIIAQRKFSVAGATLAYDKHGISYLSLSNGSNDFRDIEANGWGEKRSRNNYYWSGNWDGMPNTMDSPYCDWNKHYKQKYLLAYFNEIKRVESLLKK